MQDTYHQIVSSQRKYFQSGSTLPYPFRKEQLQHLLHRIKQYEKKIHDALWADLHIGEFAAWGWQSGLMQHEIQYILKHLHNWMQPARLHTPLFHMRSRTFIQYQPYGNTLIIGPWNFPFMLVIRPAIGAIAAGNTAILKPSEITKHTASLLEEMINTHFPPEYLHVVQADKSGTQQLLQEKFDFIFFTGGNEVGRVVYQAAASHLTPVALELGGKSPCIVDQKINLSIAAKRITWGKFSNAGQICVSPDYCIVHKSIKDAFIQEVIKNIETFFGQNAIQSPDYARIVNDAHFDRLLRLMAQENIVFGGQSDKRERYIAPTILDIPHTNTPVMQEEIFGPLLPVLTFETLDDIISMIHKNPDPLVIYVYTNNKKMIHRLLKDVRAGDMCVNENVLHFGHVHMPIGGVGASGIGKYQGKNSFHEFSHKKSVMQKKFFPDFTFRYPPYDSKKLNQLKFFFRNFWG